MVEGIYRGFWLSRENKQMEEEGLISQAEVGLIPEKPLDARWIGRLEEGVDFNLVELIQPDRKHLEEQKKRFLAGEIENPTFVYSKTAEFDAAPFEEKLLALKKDIKTQEENNLIRTLYLHRINEALASLRMVKALKEGKDRRFYLYSHFIHGKPTREAFELALEEATKLEEIKKKELEPKLGTALIEKALRLALDEYGFENWEVVQDPQVLILRVQTRGVERPTIFIPAEKEASLKKIARNVAHEIETHVLRGESGKKANLGILNPKAGLDRYVATEEGLAAYNEEQIGRETKVGLWGTLAVGLARGIDREGKERNFREVFEKIKELRYQRKRVQGRSKEEALESAEDEAWKRTARTFRGITDPSKPGNCYTKDWVYRKGNLAIWDFVKTKGEGELRRLYVGKMGIQHLGFLTELGITEPEIQPRFVAQKIIASEEFTA